MCHYRGKTIRTHYPKLSLIINYGVMNIRKICSDIWRPQLLVDDNTIENVQNIIYLKHNKTLHAKNISMIMIQYSELQCLKIVKVSGQI